MLNEPTRAFLPDRIRDRLQKVNRVLLNKIYNKHVHHLSINIDPSNDVLEDKQTKRLNKNKNKDNSDPSPNRLVEFVEDDPTLC